MHQDGLCVFECGVQLETDFAAELLVGFIAIIQIHVTTWLVESDNISVWTERPGRALASRLGFELDQGNVLAGEAVVAHPLCVDLLCQEVERRLRQPGAHAVKPKVAARFAQDRLGSNKYRSVQELRGSSKLFRYF